MYFAKFEMNGKNDSLKKVADSLQTLADVVQADKAAGELHWTWVHAHTTSVHAS